MSIKKIFCGSAIGLCLLLNGCSSEQHISPGNYDASEVGKINKVAPGVILSMRPVNISNAAADNAMMGGANVNATINNTDISNKGFEYIVKLNSGAIISVVQTDDLNLKANQAVLVIYGTTTRVVADDGVEKS